MKHLIKSALFLLALLLPSTANGFEIDGIFYSINGNEATVSSYASFIAGDIHIPRTVSYGGITYLVTSIGEQAFDQCYDLTSIEIPNSVTSIGRAAFNGCYHLTAIEIPSSVTNIGEYAFVSCFDLLSIIVEDGNTKYDSRNNCNAIIETGTNTMIVGCQNTIIPNTVTAIGDAAFCGSGLTSIVIPNSVTAIGNSAFQGSCLSNIEIPNSVTFLGDYVFMECNCLKNAAIPNSVTAIGTNAFAVCFELMDIDIPNSVTSIGDWAFTCCTSLKDVILPKSIIFIGNEAFSGCQNLTNVYSYIENIDNLSLDSSVFSLYDEPIDYQNRTLHVPAGSLAAYQADSRWSDYFGVIVEMEPTPVVRCDVDGDGLFTISDVTALIDLLLSGN